MGALIGAGAALFDALLRTALSIPVASALVIGFLALASGALHLDGLADTADGLFARGTPADRLAAMRDSRTGAFGVSAVVIVLLVEFAALSAIPADARVTAFIVGGALSRGAMAFALWRAPPARADGLGAAFARGIRGNDVVAVGAQSGLLAGALLPPSAAVVALLGAVGPALLLGAIARGRVGGVTGDVCGAIGEVAFAFELVALSGRAP